MTPPRPEKATSAFFGEPGKSAVKRPQNAPMVHSEVARAAYAIKEVGALYDRKSSRRQPDGIS